ncbi:hypothetical protein TanjilG_00420 [Lupinus angustifolius]|uniref:RING-type E3 ubiquitin transferase n=1 Tax=Lupinus angustifolius TaxID=3871 RepID=A0A1J7HVP5_LUPAN|nr:PREDICTED: E3 ubiquitin-protein ligase RNF38-like [Lupinus angustifolius]OIW10482.1 hypothetical protein TanjilG_00420 [Lupinus angustifolius]
MDHPTWYHCCVHKQQQLQNLKLADSFRIEAHAFIRYYLPMNDPNSHPLIIDTIPLFQTSFNLPCKHIFEINHKDFLRRNLVNSLYATLLTYGSPDHIESLSCEIIAQLRELYISHASKHGFTESPDLIGESFDFDVNISIDVPINISDEELGVQEQLSMQEDVKMVPASNKDVQSLKTYKLPQQCQICLEKFYGEKEDDDGDVEITTMPCGHVFHHHCIIQWLQTSHMCPLCRSPLSTDNKRKR